MNRIINKSKRIKSEQATRIKELLNIRNYINFDSIIKNLPFIMFLALLAIIYIGNIHFSEKTIKSKKYIKKTKKKCFDEKKRAR